MKIVGLKISNVKRIRAVEIKPNGHVVQVTGANGSGKSSLLDAILFALNGERAIDREPVRRGEKKAKVVLDLGEFRVTRRFTEGGGTSLMVESQDGARYPSPQKLLEGFLGAFTFDPLEFSRMDTRGQAEALRAMVGLDTKDVDQSITAMFERRTAVNKTLKAFEARVTDVAKEVDAAMDVEPIDVSALLEQMEKVAESDRARRQRIEEREADDAKLLEWEQEAADLEAQIERLKTRLADSRERCTMLKTALATREPLPDPVDVSAIRHQVQEAHEVNAARKKQSDVRGIHARLVEEAQAASAEANDLTQSIDELRSQRLARIAAVRMPVEGLGFDDEGKVVYNGIPFEQASSAEQLRVSVAIAMAANPKLRVLRVKDGSLLDDKSLKLLTEMAETSDYQMWVERVDTSGRVGISMEDGSVVAVDGEPVAQSDEAEPALAGAE